jgi:bifunctional UDP-N-acetylglucosamine pyrophosphorylase/glucosamine-1-phosphate N-acetyltransferase
MHNGGKEMTHMSAIILAAGKGTRMNSDMPKVLHQISHRSMLDYVIRSAADADIRDICLVVGHGAEQVQAAMGDRYQYALQQPQLGTGHAVQQAIPQISADIDAVMILCGDTPLLTAATLRRLKEHFTHSTAACTVLTAVLPDGGKYGRILRGANGDVEAIVEYADADESELQIREVNSGVYCFDLAILQQMLVKIKPDNAQGEYYLTDVIKDMQAGECLCL